MVQTIETPAVDLESLRLAIQDEYALVANEPEHGFQSRTDVYAGAEQSSSAANFGTLGITFRARKAVSDHEWQEALAALSCDFESGPRR
jgi:hypothetical protein